MYIDVLFTSVTHTYMEMGQEAKKTASWYVGEIVYFMPEWNIIIKILTLELGV